MIPTQSFPESEAVTISRWPGRNEGKPNTSRNVMSTMVRRGAMTPAGRGRGAGAVARGEKGAQPGEARCHFVVDGHQENLDLGHDNLVRRTELRAGPCCTARGGRVPGPPPTAKKREKYQKG